MAFRLFSTVFKQSKLFLPVFITAVFVVRTIIAGSILYLFLSICTKMRCPRLKGAGGDIVLVTKLTSMLLRMLMLVVMEGMLLLLLLRKVDAGKPLMILSSVHQMLLLKSVLTVDSKVMDHGSACG